jgi:hypothetical protein
LSVKSSASKKLEPLTIPKTPTIKMAETGHAKNVSNFEQLINIVVALGAAYMPSAAALLLTALQAMLVAAKAALTEVGAKETAETSAGKQREAAFEGQSKMATRVVAAYAASDADQLVGENLAGYVRKLRGKRAGDAPEDDPLTPDIDESESAHSVSQVSYDNLVATWRLIIQLLATQPAYKPNEADLKLEALTEYVDNLEAKNNAAKQAARAADTARADRDELLYAPKTGMLDIVVRVKKYVKSLPSGANAYQQLTALKFKRVK